ncbi:MAG: hypothetical protein RLZZ262_21 [Bacteroidota bacterium]
MQGCFKSILNSEKLIYKIVNDRDFVTGSSKQKDERRRLKEIVTDDAFVEKLKTSIAILTPIDVLIVKYQSDSVPVSEVLNDFTFNLITSFADLSAAGVITESEHSYLRNVTKMRYEFLYGDAYGLAYLLDPRFIGERLSLQLRSSLEDKLYDFGDSDQETKEQIFTQYKEFVISSRNEKVNNSFRYEMLVKKSKPPFEYWLADGSEWPELQQIALKLFSLATSTASAERSFSSQGFLHSKLRNRLGPEKTEKLMFIRSNYKQFVKTRSNSTIVQESEDIDDEESLE